MLNLPPVLGVGGEGITCKKQRSRCECLCAHLVDSIEQHHPVTLLHCYFPVRLGLVVVHGHHTLLPAGGRGMGGAKRSALLALLIKGGHG